MNEQQNALEMVLGIDIPGGLNTVIIIAVVFLFIVVLIIGTRTPRERGKWETPLTPEQEAAIKKQRTERARYRHKVSIEEERWNTQREVQERYERELAEKQKRGWRYSGR